MHCLGYCLIGAMLLGAMLAVMIDNNSPAEQAFKASLTTDQITKYAQIHKERLMIYLQGFGLGIALALGYYFFFRVGGLMNNSCIITAIILGVAYLYYMLRPKQMMLDNLSNVHQVRLYKDLYRQYQYRSYLGMTLGIGALILIVYGAGLYA